MRACSSAATSALSLHERLRPSASSSVTSVRWALGALVGFVLLSALWLALTLTAERAASASPRSRSTTSTDRSAASRASRCCGRWAACCRPTGCSARCRPSAATGCRAATPRSASSSSPATICRSASRAATASASITSASTAPSATAARCATRRPRRPGSCSACRRTSSICRASCSSSSSARSTSRVTAEAVRATFPRDGGPGTFERLLLRTGLMDRLKLQTLDLKNRIEPDPARARAALGPRPRGHLQPVQGDPVQLEPRSRCPPSELLGASDFPSLWNQKPRAKACTCTGTATTTRWTSAT